jgi:hypothetical protein
MKPEGARFRTLGQGFKLNALPGVLRYDATRTRDFW